MAAQSPEPASTPTAAVFLSYASQDANAARRICDALRASGIEVWFDQSELRGGDAWDRRIRQQIRDCALFMPVISARTQARAEGYFRLEWHLAEQRTHLIGRQRAFLVPVCIDDTLERDADVPDAFLAVQWTRLPGGETPPTFVARITALLGAPGPAATANQPRPALTSALPAQTQHRRTLWISIGLSALAIFIAGGWFTLQHRHAHADTAGKSQPTITEKSIAVLPFADLSEKHDQEYFADGLSEEILNLLARMPTLNVIGRTSSFQFKGKNEDLRTIGTTLGAAYVLEGSVQKAGERVRVIAQLVSTEDGVHRWSNTYDRPFGDVLTLQDELAAGVARALQVTIGSNALLSQTASTNPEAYDLYLRGLHALDRRDRESVEAAANYFQQALELDASFSAAATQLGRTLVNQAEFGFSPAVDTYERARRTLESAIRLDPRFGPAHAWLGWVHMAYDWDWGAADAECKQALRLSPRDLLVSACASRLAEATGHFEDAIRLITAALARDPLNPGATNSLSGAYARAGRLAEAEATQRRVLQISPTYSSAPFNLASILLALGRSREALEVMERATDRRTEGLILVYHSLGRDRESDAELATLTREHAHDRAFRIAEAHAYRAELDDAFLWLDRAYEQKDPGLYLLKGDLLLRNLESDPRYKAFLRKMNLPE
jgi:TolB-like protein/tetratricopeptide (TPR) repeat protein